MFVKEHCWFFYDYYLANTKQMKQRIIKMARALFAELKPLYTDSEWITKNNVKANIWKLYMTLEAKKEFMENHSLNI